MEAWKIHHHPLEILHQHLLRELQKQTKEWARTPAHTNRSRTHRPIPRMGNTRMTTTEEAPKRLFAPTETSLQAFISEWEAERRRAPETTATLGVCARCKVSLGATDEDKVMRIGTWGFLPNICCRSCDDDGREKHRLEQAKAKTEQFSGQIPREFLEWDAAKGNNQARAKALAKFSISSRRGMVLHGSTGSCKTRIAWELVKRLAEQPDNFTWFWLDAFEATMGGFPKEAKTADWLILDDLGNSEKKGWETKWETELLYVLRKRCDWHKPVIITTQLTPAAFKERFFNSVAAEAIMRRFRERTDSVATDASEMPPASGARAAG